MPEPVFIEFFIAVDVPQAAIVRADFIGENNALHITLPDAAKFQLEIDQTNARTGEQTDEEVIDTHRDGHNLVKLVLRCPAENGNMVFAD